MPPPGESKLYWGKYVPPKWVPITLSFTSYLTSVFWFVGKDECLPGSFGERSPRGRGLNPKSAHGPVAILLTSLNALYCIPASK